MRRVSAAFFLVSFLIQSAALAAPDPNDVTDFDSFGRNVVYLGLAGLTGAAQPTARFGVRRSSWKARCSTIPP
jgi:hypothetical protein